VAYGDGSCLAVKGKPGTYRLKAYDPHRGRQKTKTKTIYNTPSRLACFGEVVHLGPERALLYQPLTSAPGADQDAHGLRTLSAGAKRVATMAY
jgi:hypothetical protein